MSDDLDIPASLDRREAPPLPAIPPDIRVSDAQLPAAYEAAKQALAECESIDECKNWADKAQALASYARQAEDDTLEKRAMRIRGRAMRRAGELLKTFDARGKKGGESLSRTEAANSAGFSDDQRKTAVRVANVPEPEFEQAIESEKPPTVSQLAKQGTNSRPAPEGFTEATKLLGSVKRFAEFCSENDPEFVAGGVLDYECADLRKRVAAIDTWLDRFVVNLKD